MKNATNGECGLTPTVREAIEWAQAQCHSNIDLKTLLSRQRYAHLVRIRRLAMWRLRTEHRKSFPWIATALRMKDHATALHHIQCENEARGLPKNYPLNVWRAEEEQALTLNIDLIDAQVSAGQNQEDVAYQWHVPLTKLRKALASYRRGKSIENPELHSADYPTTDRIGAEPVGASM